MLNVFFHYQIIVLITKVYATLASPSPAKIEVYNKTAEKNESSRAKVSNYFLHEPYGRQYKRDYIRLIIKYIS